METDKFEQHIRTKLNEREIKPSKEAWSKISTELHTSASTKKSGYFWLGIAASILVLLGTTVFVLNTDANSTTNEIQVVAVPAKKTIQKMDVNNQKNTLANENYSAVQPVVSEDGDLTGTANEVIVASVENKESTVLESDMAESAVSKMQLKDTESLILVPEAILDLKVTEILAQVDALELNNNVTDAEVDSLLQKAQQDILRDKLFNPDYSVNAMALLTEVEEELDQSFRDQIFESLKTKFLKVRTAVADRNN